MRKRKFRVWFPLAKKMVYFDRGSQVLTDGPTTTLSFYSDGSYADLDATGAVEMDFTDLKDKRGKEIYEGDILRNRHRNTTTTRNLPDNLGERYKRSTVEWSARAAFVEVAWSEVSMQMEEFFFIPEIGMRVEVIGNVHENRELLK